MCEHLKILEHYLKGKAIPETFRGKTWSDNCREWIYFDCVLDIASLQAKFHLPNFVVQHENRDPRSGTELGLVCTLCKDAIVGLHPDHLPVIKKIID
ncbi:MAG: hypothetical protein JST86_19420 [Bacteroidetes bacterium]|nr:hypothetical protein [Bacteroidota bacterium]